MCRGLQEPRPLSEVPEQQTDSEERTAPKFPWCQILGHLPQRTVHVPQNLSVCREVSDRAEVRGRAKCGHLTSHQDGATATATHCGSPLLGSPVPFYNGHLVQSGPGRRKGFWAGVSYPEALQKGPEFRPSLTTTLTRGEQKIPPRQAQLLCLSSFLLLI